MELQTVIYSEVSQKKKNKYHILTHALKVESKNVVKKILVPGHKYRHRCREQIYGHLGGGGGWDGLGGGD